MRYTKTKIIVSIIMLVITSVFLCSTVTLAWFSSTVTKDLDFIINSDGKLIIKFDTGVVLEPTDGKLIPAKESTSAIIEGDSYDVKTLSSSITDIANTLTYKATIIAYIEELVGEEGNKTVISNPQILRYGLSASIKTKSGETYELSGDEMRNVFGYTLGKNEVVKPGLSPSGNDYTIDPPPATGYTDFELSAPYELNENKIIYIQLEIWLNQPEGLLPAELFDSDVTLYLSVSMESI